MYIGHVGAALAGKRVRRSIGLLVLLVATYTPDWADTMNKTTQIGNHIFYRGAILHSTDS